MDKPIAVNNLSPVSRRRFVKTFALGTAASTLFGKAWRASVLADITPSGSGKLRIKLSDYPALLEDFGSVRIGINPIENPIDPIGPFYPVLINHHTGNTYYALDTRCPHQGCIVPPYDNFEGKSVCACHGSGFGISGNRLNGPSTSPLRQFPITFDGVDTLTVDVPNLGYTVESTLVQSGNTPRLRLHFHAFDNVEYEVVFRERVQDAWTVTPFSTTQGGTANQLSFTRASNTPPFDGSPVSLFLNRTTQTGFYSVGIKLLDLTNG